MIDITVTRQLKAAPEDVWHIVGNFGDLSWVSDELTVEVIGSGPGMIRRLTITGMAPFDEILQTINADKMTLSYVIPKNDVIPFDNYAADISLAAGPDGSCEFVWHSSFDNGEIPAADAKSMLAGNYNMMLDALARKVEVG